jgi:N-acetylglutamate synthase-like GNAT family acetyltransferase
MITYRRITTHDPEYGKEKDLRNRVLRMPLGLVLSEQDVRNEHAQLHFVALDGQGNVIGCLLVVFSGDTARFRQMAVEEPYRERGIGTELIKQAEQDVRARNIHTVTLHARIAAKEFYEGLGYTAASGIFMEVTIPHVAMEKDLTRQV